MKEMMKNIGKQIGTSIISVKNKIKDSLGAAKKAIGNTYRKTFYSKEYIDHLNRLKTLQDKVDEDLDEEQINAYRREFQNGKFKYKPWYKRSVYI